MNQLTENPTMSSLELVEFVNASRIPGAATLAHADFLKKVVAVLGETVAGNFSGYYKASNGKQNPCYNFPKREACLMAMSYSYDLQANQLADRMTALESHFTVVTQLSPGENMNTSTNQFFELNKSCTLCLGNPHSCLQAATHCPKHAPSAVSSQVSDPVSRDTKEAPPAERIYPSFSYMVKGLFKNMAGTYDNHLHAAVGISGEVAELLNATDRDNMLEELGDIEFYIEALYQQVTPLNMAPDQVLAIQKTVEDRKASLTAQFNYTVVIAGHILDTVKKSWAYSKSLDHEALCRLLLELDFTLRKVYLFLGTDVDSVRHLNKVKLVGPGGRFESGFYTDAAAIARADKVVAQHTSGRQFFGQKAV